MIATSLAAAQSISLPGDIEANVREHLRFVTAAHAAGVQMLVFPELSLTGYELPLLQHCLLHPGDDVLAPLRALVRQTGMVVTVGAPVAPVDASTNALPAIGAITYLPDGTHTVYRKVHLHPGEERYASAGTAGSNLLRLGADTVAQAICADITHAQHPAQAAAAGASLYLAGVLESEAGYLADSAAMQRYAQQHTMGVLLANHGGPSGRYVSAGKSAFWAPGGALVVAAPGAGPCLVIATRPMGAPPHQWSGRQLPMGQDGNSGVER